jgi:hypothetical protein
VPAPPLSNSFEGGSNTTVLTVGNTGGASGNAASTITDPNSIQTFSSSFAAHGALSCKIAQTATPASTRWDWTGLGAITADVWWRAYLYLPAAPSGQHIFAGIRSSAAAALSSQASVESTRFVALSLASAALSVTSNVQVPLNAWFRVEARVRSSATVGQLELWQYNTADSLTADYHNSATGLILGVDSDQIRWGQITNTIANFVSYLDDVAVSATGPLGPAVSASVIPDLALAPLR